MHWYNKKGEESAPLSLILAGIIGIVFLLMFFGIVIAWKEGFLNKDFFQQAGCWSTNTIQCGGGLFSGWPSLCFLETIEEPADIRKLASLTRDTWWMFKEGKCDFSTVGDDLYIVYTFSPKGTISLDDFVKSLLEYNRGTNVQGKVENSDYAYLEANTAGATLCFDLESEGVQEKQIVEGETYYIIYYDDVRFVGESLIDEGPSDALLISTNPNFDKGHFADLLVTPGSPLAGAIQTGYYWTRTEEERGCLVYHPFGSINA